MLRRKSISAIPATPRAHAVPNVAPTIQVAPHPLEAVVKPLCAKLEGLREGFCDSTVGAKNDELSVGDIVGTEEGDGENRNADVGPRTDVGLIVVGGKEDK